MELEGYSVVNTFEVFVHEDFNHDQAQPTQFAKRISIPEYQKQRESYTSHQLDELESYVNNNQKKCLNSRYWRKLMLARQIKTMMLAALLMALGLHYFTPFLRSNMKVYVPYLAEHETVGRNNANYSNKPPVMQPIVQEVPHEKAELPHIEDSSIFKSIRETNTDLLPAEHKPLELKEAHHIIPEVHPEAADFPIMEEHLEQ